MLRIPKTTMPLLHIRLQVDQMNSKLQHHHLDSHCYHYHHVKPTKGPSPPFPHPSPLSHPSPLTPRPSASFLVSFPLLHIIRLNQDPCFVPFSIFHAPCSHAPCSQAFWIRCFSLKHVRFWQAFNHASPKLGLIQSSLDWRLIHIDHARLRIYS